MPATSPIASLETTTTNQKWVELQAFQTVDLNSPLPHLGREHGHAGDEYTSLHIPSQSQASQFPSELELGQFAILTSFPELRNRAVESRRSGVASSRISFLDVALDQSIILTR